MLLTVIMAFAGAQTAGAQEEEAQEEQTLCNVRFDISGKGTVKFRGVSVTNGKTIDCLIPSTSALTLTPETGYYVSSVTYDATAGLIIFLDQDNDFQWSLHIPQYEGSEPPTITVRIVFDKGLAGGDDEASAVALTADNDLSHLAGGWYKVESDLTLGHTVNLHGDTHITIATGATLTVSTSDEYGIYGSALTVEYGISGYALTVSGEGTLAVSASERAIYVDNYTQMGCAVTLSGDTEGLTAEKNVSISGGSLTTSGADWGIRADKGAITISGGTVSSSGELFGLWATDAMNITGGTVSASGNVGNGIRGYSVSITGGQVTASSGGIWSTYGDITLGCTSATDYITASGFTLEEGFYVKIADGQKLYGDGFPSASYNGTIGDPSALNGLMLRTTAAVTVSGTNEYTIWNADGWDAFCDRLAADGGKDFFSGKTVKLGADITVSRMAGSDNHEFTGTFDGGGHTLTFSHTATDNYCAPFRTVQGATAQTPAVISNLNVVSTVTADDYRHPAGLIALQSGYVSVTDCNVEAHINCTKGTVNTSDLYPAALVSQSNNTGVLTVSGCTTTGQIATDGKYAAGLVGIVQNTATIENCRASVTIQSTTSGDGTHGGIVALNSGTLSINGCVFDGKLLSTGTNATTNCGGFVGYGNGTITNSLYAPADLGTGETEVQTGDVNNHPSATFARDNATVTNSYYTRTLGTAQGKQAHSITASGNATLAHAGAATEYSVSGITAYKSGDDFTSGILYDNVLYAGSGDAVSLTLTNSSGDAPLGYKNGDYSATGGATLSGSTLTMADDNVTVSFTPGDQLRSTGQAVSVSYINADGQPASHNAIALDGTETEIGQYGEETWYFVGADISYGDEIDCYGIVNIILADGYTMTVNSGSNGIGSNGTLTIYGQTLGTGTLNATGTYYGIFHYSGSVVICGGTVNATATNGIGIYTDGIVTINGGTVNATGNNNDGIVAYGDVTITGGQVTATSNNDDGIVAYGDVTLGCTNASDFIKATSYSPDFDKSVNIASGQTLFDEDGNEYSGDDVFIPYGKTLRPYDCRLALSDDADNTAAIAAANGKVYNVTLQGRTLYKDGDWNTLCLPFAVSTASGTLSGNNVQAMTLNTSSSSLADGTLTLNFDNATGQTIPAGTPFIIKWDNTGVNITNPVFMGVTVSNATNDATVEGVLTFTGTYAPVTIPATGDNTKLYLGAANKLYYPSKTMTIGTHRAYFQLADGITAGNPASLVRAFALNFGDDESTGITEAEANSSLFTLHSSLQDWYTLDGRRLDGQPTAKGLYIHGGKKVIVK